MGWDFIDEDGEWGLWAVGCSVGGFRGIWRVFVDRGWRGLFLIFMFGHCRLRLDSSLLMGSLRMKRWRWIWVEFISVRSLIFLIMSMQKFPLMINTISILRIMINISILHIFRWKSQRRSPFLIPSWTSSPCSFTYRCSYARQYASKHKTPRYYQHNLNTCHWSPPHNHTSLCDMQAYIPSSPVHIRALDVFSTHR
ncbi:unnamed protein product [Moneuplotes crassus]|uniref:Uncharacterized protein n=1 Tax=Euplotes crassus TaxID=5936 RepID=A0AAD1Y2S4_EUPCR|nr:unnamed protein product [Moneuplotes crassus]